MRISALAGGSIPKSVAIQSPFNWEPVDIGTCSTAFQILSYKDWTRNATARQIYNVTSTELEKARLFAAHLVNIHQKQVAATIEWVELKYAKEDDDTGAVYHRLLAKELDPTLIILVLEKVTKLQREIARDIMASYPKVPVIAVAAETTPFQLAHSLFSAVHRVAHIQVAKKIRL